jgi:integrase
MGIYKQARSPFWWVRLERPGLPALRQSTKIPHAGQHSRADALAVYRARMGDLARDRNDVPTARPADAGTLSEWLEWYRAHETAQHRGAARELEILARFDRDLGHLPIRAIDRTTIAEWITARQKCTTGPRRRQRPISPNTINREIRALKSVFVSAAAHQKIKVSPIAGLPNLHAPTPRRRYITPDEESRILAAMRRPDDRALFVMALDTLLRLGDCLDVRRTDYQAAKRRIWVADPKTGAGRYVPVSARLRDALKEIPKSTGPYFFAHRRADTAQKSTYAVRQMLERACAAARPPVAYGRQAGGITWHWATRRTTANRMARAGLPLTTTQAAGGWKSARMVLEIYTEGEYADVAAALRKLPAVPMPPAHTPRIRKAKTRKNRRKSA